jgi:hypothetical protein
MSQSTPMAMNMARELVLLNGMRMVAINHRNPAIVASQPASEEQEQFVIFFCAI